MLMTAGIMVMVCILGLLVVSEVTRDVGHDRVAPGGLQGRL